MYRYLVAVGMLLCGVVLAVLPQGQLQLHTNLAILASKVELETLPVEVAAGVFYLLVGLFCASAVSIVRRHVALPFLTVLLSMLLLNNPWLQRTHQTFDLFWRDLSILGGLVLLRSNITVEHEKVL